MSELCFSDKIIEKFKVMSNKIESLNKRVKDLDIENKELKSKLYKNK